MSEYKQYGKELEEALRLSTAPLAVKFLRSEEEIPAGAVRPQKDLGVHYALCQAFALARRQRKSIAMFKEDHWCWAPLISFGLVEFHKHHPSYEVVTRFIGIEDKKQAERFVAEFPRLSFGEYEGLVCAPLSNANFAPDLVLVYANSAQMRSLLLAVKFKTGRLVQSQFDAIDSCVHSIVPVVLNGEYRLTLPDPGEHERALTGEDELIFTIPEKKLPEIMSGLRVFKGFYGSMVREMRPDYARPAFYNELFAMWGLEEGEEWQK